ncbi:MAG: hypothetical protein KC609_00485 [Myxococcales bacterium]|nr:hypothetical protein [Myxococcales bacterium]
MISLVARGLTLLWLVLVGWLVWRMPAPRPLEARDVNTAALEPLMRQLADRRYPIQLDRERRYRGRPYLADRSLHQWTRLFLEREARVRKLDLSLLWLAFDRAVRQHLTGRLDQPLRATVAPLVPPTSFR